MPQYYVNRPEIPSRAMLQDARLARLGESRGISLLKDMGNSPQLPKTYPELVLDV